MPPLKSKMCEFRRVHSKFEMQLDSICTNQVCCLTYACEMNLSFVNT